MHPSRNIAMLKENVQKPGASFELYKQTTRMTMAEYDNIKDATMFVEEEDSIIAGVSRKVKRLYVKPQYSDFVGVGWIINEDITSCMVCGESFGLFRWPHHCRSCGNLVCHPCSPESVVIVELQELGEVRVCVQCYWGQYPVHAAHVRKPSFAEVEEEDLSSKTPEKEMKPTPVKETQPPGSQRSGCRVCPHPIFALFTTRKLSVKDAGPATMHSRTSSRVLFVNICVHAALEEYPVETEFVISEDIYTYKPADSSGASSSSTNGENTQQEEHVYEVYHVILRPELLSEDALSEDEEQCNQAAEAILIALSEKFGYRLSKKFTLLHEQKYIGDKIQEVSLPSITEISGASMSSPTHVQRGLNTETELWRFMENIRIRLEGEAVTTPRSKSPKPSDPGISYEVNPLSRNSSERKSPKREGSQEIRLAGEEENLEAEEKERQRKAAEDEAKRKAAEKTAAEEKERQRKAAEEEAKRKAAEEEAKRIAAEKAAAEEKERQRKAAEEEAKRKAAEEEAKRIAAEKAAAEEKEVSVSPDSSELASPVNVISPAPIEDPLKSSFHSHNDLSILHNDDHPSNSVPPTSSARPSSMDEGSPSLETLFIPAILVEPTPGVVIKTKREDSTKIFVNVCHHVLIPLLNADNIYVTHPYYPDYLQLYFTQFTLNKSRYVMYVGLLRETADKEGGTCFVSDVVVHTSVFQDCMKDAELCDKFYLKVLKALARHNNTDFDADYKLPKILRNYKGNEVDKLNVPAYTSVGRPVPQTESSRNSFRYGAIDTSNIVSSKIEPTKSEGVVSTAVSENAPVVPSAITGSEPKPVVPTPSPSYFTVDAELNRKWKAFLSPNTNVVHTSLTSKKNMVGMKIVRQLILTDEPGMLYVDTSNMTLKGNIAWDRSNPPKAAVIDKQTFTVEVPGRVYKFTDLSQGANTWVQKINAVVEHNKSARK